MPTPISGGSPVHGRHVTGRVESPADSIAAAASAASSAPGRPLTPTAPTRRPPSKAATPPRKNVKNGSKLARSTGSSATFSASSRGRVCVAAGRRVRLALRVQPGVRGRAVHRRGRDDLAVVVGDEHRHRPGRRRDDVVDDLEGLARGCIWPHSGGYDGRCGRRARSALSLASRRRPVVPGRPAVAEGPAPPRLGDVPRPLRPRDDAVPLPALVPADLRVDPHVRR